MASSVWVLHAFIHSSRSFLVVFVILMFCMVMVCCGGMISVARLGLCVVVVVSSSSSGWVSRVFQFGLILM